MSTEKITYDYGDGWERTIIINHGGSESQVVYDSKGELTDWSQPKEPLNKLQMYLKRAKANDDL